jgi:hypothetical protein
LSRCLNSAWQKRRAWPHFASFRLQVSALQLCEKLRFARTAECILRKHDPVLQALNAVEAQVNFLRDERKSISARIGVILFWALVAAVLGPYLQNVLNLVERHDDLFVVLGAALGFCIGAYAAFGRSWLAVLLAFPAVLFGLLPF